MRLDEAESLISLGKVRVGQLTHAVRYRFTVMRLMKENKAEVPAWQTIFSLKLFTCILRKNPAPVGYKRGGMGAWVSYLSHKRPDANSTLKYSIQGVGQRDCICFSLPPPLSLDSALSSSKRDHQLHRSYMSFPDHLT